MRRYTPIPRSRGTVIPPFVRFDVLMRDGYQCVGQTLGWAAHRDVGYVVGALEIDHVRASHGVGMKSETAARNLVTLCGPCHRWKTSNGKVARPLLIAYLESCDAAR